MRSTSFLLGITVLFAIGCGVGHAASKTPKSPYDCVSACSYELHACTQAADRSLGNISAEKAACYRNYATCKARCGQ